MRPGTKDPTRFGMAFGVDLTAMPLADSAVTEQLHAADTAEEAKAKGKWVWVLANRPTT